MKALRRENVWINNVSLRDVDARIINIKLHEPDPAQELTYGQFAGRDGRLLLGRRRTGKTLRVEFMIRELYDLAARAAVLDKVNAWAAAGVLLSSTRPEMQVRVIPAKYAAAGDIRDYMGAYTVEFEAAGAPYWEERAPQQLLLTGASASRALSVRGNAETVLDGVVTPTGGTLTSLTVAAAGGGQNCAIALSGLSVAAGTAVSITHDERGTLAIAAGGSSLLSKRTAASDDDLFALPGTVTVSVNANTAVSAAMTARGRWL